MNLIKKTKIFGLEELKLITQKTRFITNRVDIGIKAGLKNKEFGGLQCRLIQRWIYLHPIDLRKLVME